MTGASAAPILCRSRGIEVRRDQKAINYGDSIRQFMDRIGAAGHVVLILSDAYFKSEYCMYELRRIHENRSFAKRVNPIVLKGTRFHKAADRLPYIDHWQAEIDELQSGLARLSDPKYTGQARDELDGYAENRRLTDTLLSILADMNTLTEDVHVDSDFAALLDRIAPAPNGPPDDAFRARITDEIRRILTHGNRLSEALQAALSDAGIPPAADLAASLCAADPEKALEDLLFPATRSTLALLDPRHQEFADTWNDAKAALAWLSLLAVDGASLGLAQRNALADGQLSFEIVVETPLGVELVSSRHRQSAICAH
ncbi:MAG: toll/interleukin-1 receptor domain-containing protein [Candidatus Accumulibacter sp.]|nr:toll/interleukin-1 receptor domain-containing protein [Accumulibacter sp.]